MLRGFTDTSTSMVLYTSGNVDDSVEKQFLCTGVSAIVGFCYQRRFWCWCSHGR